VNIQTQNRSDATIEVRVDKLLSKTDNTTMHSAALPLVIEVHPPQSLLYHQERMYLYANVGRPPQSLNSALLKRTEFWALRHSLTKRMT
jgi:hypothetical protein